MYANQEKKLSPLTPPPPPEIWLQGLEPQWVNFFQKPHICVFKMISTTRGSFWGLYIGV